MKRLPLPSLRLPTRRGRLFRVPTLVGWPLPSMTVNKRQRFVLSVAILSVCLFFTEYLFGRASIFVSLGLSLLSTALFFWANYRDIRSNFSLYYFILPFFFTLAFGQFLYLAPDRLLTRIIMTFLFALGMYSLFLSVNIFTVASMRTIALLSGARIVSFLITLISYGFLINIIFTLHVHFFITLILVAIVTFFLIMHALWTITLEKGFAPQLKWGSILTLALVEIVAILWFWSTDPTIIALYLTAFFYTIVGPVQIWLNKRFFKGVLAGYLWVLGIVLLLLLFFTFWQ